MAKPHDGAVRYVFLLKERREWVAMDDAVAGYAGNKWFLRLTCKALWEPRGLVRHDRGVPRANAAGGGELCTSHNGLGIE